MTTNKLLFLLSIKVSSGTVKVNNIWRFCKLDYHYNHYYYHCNRVSSYASDGLVMADLSVCPSVCPSHSGIVLYQNEQS